MASPTLLDGYADGWPTTTPVGMFLDHLRTGNTVLTAALVAGLVPEEVEKWLVVGSRLLSAVDGELNDLEVDEQPVAAFAAAAVRAQADADALLTAVVMDAAIAETKDSWRAAAWLMDHRVAATSTTPETEDDDDLAGLSAPVFLPEDS